MAHRLSWSAVAVALVCVTTFGCGRSTGTDGAVSLSVEVAPSAPRIIPVDGDLAEIVFALGLGHQVVAVDLSATFPPEVEALPQIGYQRALSTEPIAAFEPTIVLATDLAQPEETLDELRTIGIEVFVIERDMTLDGPAAKIRAVANALGVPDEGEELARQVQAEIDAVRDAAASVVDRPRVAALYLRGEAVQLLFGAGSGVDAILDGVGAVDVGSDLGVDETAPISAEALVVARPDVVLVADRGLDSVGGIDGLLTVPGVAGTPAGDDRYVLVHEDQKLFGLGPRTGELMRALLAELHPDLALPIDDTTEER